VKCARGQAAVALCEDFGQPPDEKKPGPAAFAAALPKEPLVGHVDLGIEALRRENGKCLEAEVARWNALTPHEKPFAWQGKSAAEILAWRNAKLKQMARLHEVRGPLADEEESAAGMYAEGVVQSALAGTRVAPCRPKPGCACFAAVSPKAPQSPVRACMEVVRAYEGEEEPEPAEAEGEPLGRHAQTTYEEKLARWKRAILEEKIIDLDDAAFGEKFAEWDTHAFRLEAIKQEIVRLEKKAVELKIEELKEQAAKQQAKVQKTAEPKCSAEKNHSNSTAVSERTETAS